MPFQPAGQYLRVCFTANIPDGKTHADFNLNSLRTRLNPSYMICGRETAGGTGKLHFQGYLEFPKKRLGSAMMNAFSAWGIKAHLEIAMGTAQQNKDYCSKEDDDAFEFGEPSPGKGARTDLAEMVQMVKDGKSDRDLLDKDPRNYMVHMRAFKTIRTMFAVKRHWATNLIFLHGPTGTGKSMHAQELEPETVEWTGQYLNGYTGTNPVILFDDFDWTKMSFRQWLTMTDRYPMVMNVKFEGHCNFAPKTIIFTSNDDPKTWYPEAPAASLEAIHRRMDEFGDIRFLGTLVPKTTTLLDKYIIRPSASEASSTVPPIAPSGAGAAGTAASIDLTQDTDDEDETFEDSVGARDWDAHSDVSNVDFAEARGRRIVEHDREAKRIRLAAYVPREWET